MKITEVAVKRPVTTIMFFLGIVIMGFISLYKLPRELLPSLVYPQITVITVYENATPEEIERQITKIIEESVGTVNNLKSVNSISREGLSLVMAEFNWGTQMDIASMDVREKIDLIKERLPRESREPIVMKFNPFELPVLTLLVSPKSGATDAETLYKMRELAKKVIKTSLEKIEGVASVEIKGGREREIVVDVDQGRLQASGVSLLEIVNILKNANLTYPAGTIKKRFYEYLIRTMGEYKDVEDITATPVKLQYYKGRREMYMDQQQEKEREKPKGMIVLKNIAKVSDTYKKQESIFRHNNKESISISIKKQSGSNIVKVVERIRESISEMHHKIPDLYQIEIIYDQSEYIEKSIYGVAESAVLGGILAFLVLLLFLKSIQNSLIVTISIPVSLMCTFILMYLQKISINMMSLGGLALGVGMLVDNSVVVLENIYRLNVFRPDDIQQNAIDGTSEVTGAIISSTLTTITVFLPFVFISGVAGQLFKELAYTVTFSLITSLLVAVTLIPRLAAGVKYRKFVEPKWSEALKDFFDRTLKLFLNKRSFYISIIAILFLFSVLVLFRMNKEFIPQTKQTQFVMKIELPPGTPLTVTNEVVKEVETIVRGVKEVKDITTSIGSEKGSKDEKTLILLEQNQAEIMISLQGRKGFAENVIKNIKSRLGKQVVNADIEYVTQAGIFGSALSGSAPISIEVKGEKMENLIQISEDVENIISKVPEIYGVKNKFRGRRPEIRINVNKDRASLYDISTQNVTVTAQTAIKGYVATKLKERDEEVDIRVTLREEDRANFDQIGNIVVRSPLNIDVRLNQLASFKEEKSSSEIMRKDGQRIINVTANYIGTSLSNVLKSVRSRLKKIDIGNEYLIDIAGEQEKMQESFGELMFVLILSLVFVYMIMASQFESLWQPFIVIFTVPLSAIGVAMFLVMSGTSLNVVVLLGITMLGGIVVNNGIVLISYFNLLSKKEEDLGEMVVSASITRLRPVLMTALTTTLGLIPMAVSGGQGSELRAPLAITVIGGLITSTFLTLYVIPAMYLFGKKVELVIRDSKSNASIASKNVAELIDKEKCVMIFGGSASSVAISGGKVARKKGKIYFGTLTYSNATTGTQGHKYMFRECYNAYQGAKALASYMSENFSGKKFFYITADYTWGWTTEDSIRKFSGTVDVNKHSGVYTPFPGATDSDFQKALFAAKASKPDVLVLVLFGNDMSKCLKQATALGLKNQMNIIVPNLTLGMAESAGPKVMEGVVGALPWCWKIPYIYNFPKGKEFVKKFSAKYKTYPSSSGGSAYTILWQYKAAVEEAKTFDSKAVIKKLEGKKYTSLKDEQQWRNFDHQSIQTVYAVKCKNANEVLKDKYKQDYFEIINSMPGRQAARTYREWTVDRKKSGQPTKLEY